MKYDGFDRQSRWVFPSRTSPGVADQSDYEQHGYDGDGNRTSLRKRDGSVLSYQYDALDRMTVKIVPERAGLTAAQTRDVYYEYDLRGLQTKARFDGLGGEGVTNAYDGFGRLVSSTSDMGGTARTVGNVFDSDGARVRIDHPDGSFFTYDLDGLGRPLWIRQNGDNPVTGLSYDPAGRPASSAWHMTTYGYDGAGRLQRITHDPLDSDRDQVFGFAYNPASQITNRTGSNDAYAWTGSVTANRSYSANGQNQYTSAGAATFGYDPNGNLASTSNAPWSTAYVYDVENRLVSASGTHVAELVYDPLGRLFQVSSGAAGIRRLVYDGDALIAEYDSGGGMPHRYVHGNDPGADDPVAWYHNSVYGWRRILFHDQQGSIVGMTDMYGHSIAANSYDEYGIPAANNLGRFGYTGQTWVPELGLWYYKARLYSPYLGRFLQIDPIGYEGGINLYGYVGNDPVNNTDSTGEACDEKDRSGCGTAVGASSRAAAVGVGSDRARRGYEQRVRGLGPGDSAGRAAAKAQARAATPREVRAVIVAKRPGLGAQPGSGGRANVSNAGVNQTARTLGVIGKGAGVIAVGVAAADIATSNNPTRATVANVTAGIGGILGGAGGATLGALGGPAAPVTVPAGGVAGSIAGGNAGYRLGEKIYDWFSGN
jgi:RHS repeat-associated protein